MEFSRETACSWSIHEPTAERGQTRGSRESRLDGGGVFPRGDDLEDLVQAGDLEQLEQLLADAAEHQAAAGELGELLVHRQDDPDGLAGQVFHPREVEQDLVAV